MKSLIKIQKKVIFKLNRKYMQRILGRSLAGLPPIGGGDRWSRQLNGKLSLICGTFAAFAKRKSNFNIKHTSLGDFLQRSANNFWGLDA